MFRATPVGIVPSEPKICRSEKMLWLGSCFAESMQSYLERYQFQALVNPMGVIFHPEVMARLMVLEPVTLTMGNFLSDGIWKNWWLGVPFFAHTEAELNHQILVAHGELKNQIANCSWLVCTWGTAFLYKHATLGTVGKCHKMPGGLFEKVRSAPGELVEMWRSLITQIRTQNPELKIILSISPVRHTRDTLPLNNLSKSILKIACQELVESIPNLYYFPAFEIVMDELREYRFFKSDGIHPSEETIAYIWHCFEAQFLAKEETQINRLIDKLLEEKAHKPFVARGPSYDKWQASIAGKEAMLKKMGLAL